MPIQAWTIPFCGWFWMRDSLLQAACLHLWMRRTRPGWASELQKRFAWQCMLPYSVAGVPFASAGAGLNIDWVFSLVQEMFLNTIEYLYCTEAQLGDRRALSCYSKRVFLDFFGSEITTDSGLMHRCHGLRETLCSKDSCKASWLQVQCANHFQEWKSWIGSEKRWGAAWNTFGPRGSIPFGTYAEFCVFDTLAIFRCERFAVIGSEQSSTEARVGFWPDWLYWTGEDCIGGRILTSSCSE